MQTCAAPGNSPLPVPDGSFGTIPMTVDKDPSGQLVVAFDEVCGAVSTNLIYGDLATLDSYAVTGSACSISNPETWVASPIALPDQGIWFLVVRDNDEGSESSWGQSSTGERNGLLHSGQCDTSLKDLIGSCP